MNRSLIEKIGKADPNIYSQTMSLSLRCAKYSKFVFVNNVLSHKKYNNLLIDESFESYNNLRSIYNFVINHKEICQTLKPELIKRVYLETLSNKSKINYYLQYLYSKYTKSIKLDKIIQFYKNEYEKLF